MSWTATQIVRWWHDEANRAPECVAPDEDRTSLYLLTTIDFDYHMAYLLRVTTGEHTDYVAAYVRHGGPHPEMTVEWWNHPAPWRESTREQAFDAIRWFAQWVEGEDERYGSCSLCFR